MTRIWLSELDEQRWGVRTARGSVRTVEELAAANRFCQDGGIRLLVVRVPTDRPDVVQEAERAGYFLTGTLLQFRRSLDQPIPPPSVAGGTIEPAGPGEADAIRAVAAAAFRGYQSHYRADPRLPGDLCDDLYADWAWREASGDADCCLVARIEDKIVGFATATVLEGGTVGRGLYGVHPQARGRGAYRALVSGAMAWAQEEGLGLMTLSTQITNLASQRLWADLGFRIHGSEYTFHRWFE